MNQSLSASHSNLSVINYLLVHRGEKNNRISNNLIAFIIEWWSENPCKQYGEGRNTVVLTKRHSSEVNLIVNVNQNNHL